MQLLTSPMPLSSEVIDDRVATVLEAGTNITLNYDDTANVLTISAATSASGAPTDAEYVTSSVNGTLSAERVLTDTATVTWDRTTPGQMKANAAAGTSYTDEQAQDAIGNILQDSATIDYVYNDTTPYITGLVKDNSITESMLSLSDNTTKDASVASHGLLMKLSGNTVHFLRGDGTWVTPPAGTSYTDEQAQDAIGAILVDSARIDFTYSDATPSITADIVAGSITETQIGLSDVTADNATVSAHGFLPKLSGAATEYLNGNGAWTTPAGGGGAPTDAEYVTSVTNATLSAERVLTDTTTISWDRVTPGQIKASTVLEGIQDIIGAMFVDTFTVNFSYSDVLGQITADLIANSITFNYLAQINVPPKLLGRYSAGAGNVQEITLGADFNLKTTGELNLPPRFLLMGA